MTYIFVAKDGKQFDSESDCELHEWMLDWYEVHDSMSNVKTIRNFDRSGHEITCDYFNKEYYEKSWYLIIHNEDELTDFKKLVEHKNWEDWKDIKHVGAWTKYHRMYDEIWIPIEED